MPSRRSSTGTRPRPASTSRALFEGQEVFREGVDCEKAIPTSLRINLADPSQFDQITAALSQSDDRRDRADPVHGTGGPRRLGLPRSARSA